MGLYINGKLVGISLPQTGGGQPINNQDITVTENGTYEAEEGYTGLGEVTVNVPSADEVTATNLTGSPVAVGDKVWLNKTTSQNNTKNIASGYGKWLSIISPDGNYLIMNGYTSNTSYQYIYPRLYDISDPSNAYDTGSLTQNSYRQFGCLQFCYNSDGDLIAPFDYSMVLLKSSGGYATNTSPVWGNDYPIGFAHLKDNLYAVTIIQNHSYDYSGFHLCRLDHSTCSILQSSDRLSAPSSAYQWPYAVDGYFASDKYFLVSPSSTISQTYRYEITDLSTLATSYSQIGNKFGSQMLSTEDNVWTMSCNAIGRDSGNIKPFTVYKPTDASTPAALSRFIDQYCWAAYNKKNKILTVVQWNTLNYGIFKYENGDFTELNYNLLEGINTSGKVLGGFITASEDLRRFAFALGDSNSNRGSFGYNTTYTTYVAERINTSTSWKIYKFDRQTLYQSSISGVAKEAGANGEEITVKTLLPRKVDVTITVDQDDAEIIAE